MPLSDDVLRGLRWGAILLAVLAIGVACYRVMRESPPKPPQEISSAPVLSAEPPDQSDSLTPTKTIDKPAGKPALFTSGSRPVPPPPARVAKPIVANPPAGSGDSVPAGEPASKNQDESAVIEEKPTGPSEEPDDRGAVQSPSDKTDPAESSTSAAFDENAAKPEGRGKRWIKTVGKWLGIGRKDPQPH